MTRAAVTVAAAVVALGAVAGAGAAPSRDLLIRPGVGIGKMRLGMTAAQVRTAMGKPQAVLVQQESFGRRVVEWQYAYGAYTVRLEGRRTALRVTGVSTTFVRERTRAGFGVGTPESRIERVYAGRVRCEALTMGPLPGGGHRVLEPSRDCVVTHANRTETVFVTWVKPASAYDAPPTAEEWERRAEVLAVEVRTR